MFLAMVILLLFVGYIVIDIKKLIGDNENQYEIDDYIMATLDIYIDVIVILLLLLFLMIRCKK